MGTDNIGPAENKGLTLERRVELLEERARIEDRLWHQVGETMSSIPAYIPPPKKVELIATLDDFQDTA